MSDFTLYFETGWHHIISRDALDHILFILVLTAIYLPPNWKQVLVLVTAFTVGHSLTLASSVYDIIRFPSVFVEFLIPCTIIITGIFNMLIKKFTHSNLRISYTLALFFGLIHGMGFANTIRFMLADGQSIALPLIGFNIGLEAGQIALVTIILLAAWIVVQKAGLQRRWWVWLLSGVSIILAINMALQRWPK